MSEKPKNTVGVRDFPGLVTRIDRQDSQPGAAADQLNVTSSKVGRLVVRPGYRRVRFEENDA